jgi:SAM-dependent methyltransferase
MTHWTEELFRDNPDLFQSLFDMRAETVPVEVDFLLEKLGEHGFESKRILDLNCGVGRHAIELARRGIGVVGTDISSQYLDVAARRAESAGVAANTTFKIVDMREIAAGLAAEKPFDGIICMWTAFGFYDDDTNEDILKQCVGLIKPGGFFVLDIINRDWLILNFAERGYTTLGDLMITEDRKFDIKTSRNQSTWTYFRRTDGDNYRREKSVTIDHRIWSLHELAALFKKAGLDLTATYTGFGMGFNLRQGVIVGLNELRQSRMLLCIGRKSVD